MQQTLDSTGMGPAGFRQKSIKHKNESFWTTCKKVTYFLHFIFIAIFTTYILSKYPEAREPSFTLCALIVFGYMAVWTILFNFIFLLIGKENWAVMFDRLFIKFFMMLWPIAGAVSYIQESFLNINEVAYFTLYMTIVSFLLILYELYTCIFAEHENPKFIFEPNDLKQSDETVWNQRKLYNQYIMKRNKINIDA